MSEQDLQLFLEFPADDDRMTVPAEHIAAPEDGSLLEEIPEPGGGLFPPDLFHPVPREQAESREETAVVSGEEVPADDPLPKAEQEDFQMTRHDLQRASLAWLASLNPTAAAIRVPTRLAKFRAGAAAFWSSPGRHRLLQPDRTVVVEERVSRHECWPECSDTEMILPSYRECQAARKEMEAAIRKEEPHLLDSDVLFPEIEYWNYEKTANPDYKPCLAKLAEFESALYRGSRFERIREGAVANELYLAVPAGLIRPDELAEGWGLLYVSDDLSVEVVCEAARFDCPREHMLHLSQNIAASSLRDVLFAHGIYQEPDGKISYRRPPKMRPRQIWS